LRKWDWALIRAIDIPRIFRTGKAFSGGAVVESVSTEYHRAGDKSRYRSLRPEKAKGKRKVARTTLITSIEPAAS
jgi:hypothetical protein